ncbi:hypothetical protein AB9F29_20320 [Falsihalocynthiibacter sp. S25ZX9]|uniref:hypothetical protein n=1 Tax=Falsihalocynthiibacter sp. S25ZX9 TaxID=3240870 RepID=UPI00350EAD9B
MDTLQIAGSAVTTTARSYSSGDAGIASSYSTVATKTITRVAGYTSLLEFNCSITSVVGPTARIATFKIKRDGVEIRTGVSVTIPPTGTGTNTLQSATVHVVHEDGNTSGGSTTYTVEGYGPYITAKQRYLAITQTKK